MSARLHRCRATSACCMLAGRRILDGWRPSTRSRDRDRRQDCRRRNASKSVSPSCPITTASPSRVSLPTLAALLASRGSGVESFTANVAGSGRAATPG
jgi:hypothetical protein